VYLWDSLHKERHVTNEKAESEAAIGRGLPTKATENFFRASTFSTQVQLKSHSLRIGGR